VDVIEFAKMHFPKEQVKGFLRINALKYLVRYEEKGGLDDLDKVDELHPDVKRIRII
jgi:hypothetical protein